MNFSDIVYEVAAGIPITLQYTVITIVLSIITGSLFAVLQYRKKGIASFLVRLYVSIVRGTPLMVQLMIVYFTVPKMTGINLSSFWAITLAFYINSTAYMTESIRAGIQAIPKSQFDAAHSLHLSPSDMWIDIIMPQVAVNIMPAVINEMISLLKETAIISIIGEMDITGKARAIGTRTYDYFVPLMIAAAIYYIIAIAIEQISYLIISPISKRRS